MAKLPSYISEGWRPNGPGNCRCPDCSATVTTNALGRAAHARACYAKRMDLAATARRAREAAERVREDAKVDPEMLHKPTTI